MLIVTVVLAAIDVIDDITVIATIGIVFFGL